MQQISTLVAVHLQSAGLQEEILIAATFPKMTKAYVVFSHAELCITPFTRVSLSGQDEGVAGLYQAKDQERNRRKLHGHHFL